MLTGKELGAAIKSAIDKKKVRQTELARHFGVKPPSIQDWINKGTISKDKLPDLWAYFSDVVGPEHWGLSAFPQGSHQMETKVAAERQISESQWQLLQDFEMLPDDEKQALRSTLRGQADRVRKIVAEYLGRQGVTGTASDARVAESFGAAPAPAPGGPGSYQKITPIPAPAGRKHKVK